MKVNVTISVSLDKDEELLPEAKAIQNLQDLLASTARMSVDELAEIWRLAVKNIEKVGKQRPRHSHKRQPTA